MRYDWRACRLFPLGPLPLELKFEGQRPTDSVGMHAWRQTVLAVKLVFPCTRCVTLHALKSSCSELETPRRRDVSRPNFDFWSILGTSYM